MTLSAALNGWFLVPLASYASTTSIGRRSPDQQWFLADDVTRSFDSWRVVFSPFRTYPVLPVLHTNPFYVQAPVYALLWLTCVALFLLLRRKRSRDVAMFFALIAILGVLFTLVLSQGLWDVLPSFAKRIQFRYRLHTYINYTVVGLVIVGLVLAARTSAFRVWLATLALATGAALGLAIWQAWSAPKYRPVEEVVKTSTHIPQIAYANCPQPCPVLADYRVLGDIDASSLDVLNLDVSSARSGKADIRVPPGGPYVTNIVWSPFIELDGDARIIGGSKEGWAVIAPTRGSEEAAPAGASHLRQRATGAVLAGRLVSGIAAAALVTWLTVVVIIRARRRQTLQTQLAPPRVLSRQ
jgi:hypothetical protein